HREVILDMFAREGGLAGRDAAEHGHDRCLDPRIRGERHRAWLRRIVLQQSGAFEVGELGVDRRRRGQTHGLPDLANGGWIAALAHGLGDEVHDPLLPGSDVRHRGYPPLRDLDGITEVRGTQTYVRFWLDTEHTFGQGQVVNRTRVRRRRLGAGGLLVLALSVSAPAVSAPVTGRPSRGTGAPDRYVVQPGDTLWSIALRHAPGNDPRRIIQAIVDANQVDAG